MRDDRVNIVCKVVAILSFLFLIAPLVVIILTSFTPTNIVTFPPQGFTLKWYENIFNKNTHFMDGLVNSLKVGILFAPGVNSVLGKGPVHDDGAIGVVDCQRIGHC